MGIVSTHFVPLIFFCQRVSLPLVACNWVQDGRNRQKCFGPSLRHCSTCSCHVVTDRIIEIKRCPGVFSKVRLFVLQWTSKIETGLHRRLNLLVFSDQRCLLNLLLLDC